MAPMKRTLIAATLVAAAATLVAGGITYRAVPTALAAPLPPDQAHEQLAAAAKKLVDSAQSVESDLALLESASSENPEGIQEYASRVENGLHALVDSEQGLLDLWAIDAVPLDPNAIVQGVLRESYMETTEDLRLFGEKVKYFNELKKWVDAEKDRSFNVGVVLLQRDVKDALSTAGFISSLLEKPAPCP
jgi:hypothetical protein